MAPDQVAQALQTSTQQVNCIASRIQDLEIRDYVSTEQLDTRSSDLRNLIAQAIRGVEIAVAALRMRGADARGSGPSKIVLMSDKNDTPQHFG